MILNVADLKISDKNFIPLEQDTIGLAINKGFKYIGKIDMVMAKMVGCKSENVKNNYFNNSQACRTTVEVNALPTDIAIELKCIAKIS